MSVGYRQPSMCRGRDRNRRGGKLFVCLFVRTGRLFETRFHRRSAFPSLSFVIYMFEYIHAIPRGISGTSHTCHPTPFWTRRGPGPEDGQMVTPLPAGNAWGGESRMARMLHYASLCGTASNAPCKLEGVLRARFVVFLDLELKIAPLV